MIPVQLSILQRWNAVQYNNTVQHKRQVACAVHVLARDSKSDGTTNAQAREAIRQTDGPSRYVYAKIVAR